VVIPLAALGEGERQAASFVCADHSRRSLREP
jgi:hypothetical protein